MELLSSSNSSSNDNRQSLNLWKLALYILAACILAIAISCDFSGLFENSDYISCLYVGAKLFAQHRFDEIYAPLGATGFYHLPCDIAGHKFLPHLQPNHISLFNYCPLIAFLLSPLSYLPPTWSLLVWQSISLSALAISICLLVKGKEARALAFSFSLLFLPITITLWIGQMDLVFGVLCFAFGYQLLIKKKTFCSGLVFAISCLKPQMLILPALISLVLLLKRHWHFAAGFAAGAALIIILNISVGGLHLFLQWLWNVRLCEIVFTNPNAGKIDLMQYLIISLPGVLLLSVFKNPLPWLKPLIYAVNIILILFTALTCIRFSKIKPDEHLYIAYTVILGLLLMPLIIPNYLYYDASTLLIAGCICCDKQFQQQTKLLSYILITLLTAALLNTYGLIFLINKNLASPAFPLIVLILTFLRVGNTSWSRGYGAHIANVFD